MDEKQRSGETVSKEFLSFVTGKLEEILEKTDTFAERRIVDSLANALHETIEQSPKREEEVTTRTYHYKVFFIHAYCRGTVEVSATSSNEAMEIARNIFNVSQHVNVIVAEKIM